MSNLQKAIKHPIRALFTMYVRFAAKKRTPRLNLFEKGFLNVMAGSLLPFTVESGKRMAYLRYLQSCGLSALPERYFEPVPRVEDIDATTLKPKLTAADPGETEDMLEISSNLVDPIVPVEFDKWLGEIETNKMFRGLDAFAYSHIVKKYKPRKIIEIGSGYTAFIALKTAKEQGLKTNIISVEPYPSDFLVALSEKTSNHELIRERIQDVTLSSTDIFSQLEENDILFIDSTHVCSIGGDLPVIFSEILPKIKSGVIVHVHDVSWPYEYPRNLVFDNGRFYNELYLLSTLLNHGNYKYLFGSYHLLMRKGTWLNPSPNFPYTGGLSLWMRKG